MSTNTINIQIVSAEKELYNGTAVAVFASAEMGEVGIFPRHCPLLTCLRPGNVRICHAEDTEPELFYVSGGILEVQPDNITILADTAMRGEDLDEERAKMAKQKAEEALQSKLTKEETAKAMAELAQAAAQIRMIEELRKIRR